MTRGPTPVFSFSSFLCSFLFSLSFPFVYSLFLFSHSYSLWLITLVGASPNYKSRLGVFRRQQNQTTSLAAAQVRRWLDSDVRKIDYDFPAFRRHPLANFDCSFLSQSIHLSSLFKMVPSIFDESARIDISMQSETLQVDPSLTRLYFEVMISNLDS